MAISDEQYRHECEFLDGMCACRPHEDTPEMRELVHTQAVRLRKILKISPFVDEDEYEAKLSVVNEHEVAS